MKSNLCHERAYAARGSNFLLLRQKKVTKEKATPTFALIRYLERKRGAVGNSLRSNNGPLHRRFHSKSRIGANVGVAFSLVTFFWRRKRKILPRAA